MHQVEAADVFGGEAVYHIAHVATYTAFIGTEEDAVPGFVNGHASSAVDAQGLLAAKKLDALVLKRRDNVLCFLIGSEDSHVSAAVDAELLGEDGEVHRIAAGVHGLDVLVLIDDIVSKAEHAYRIGCHG